MSALLDTDLFFPPPMVPESSGSSETTFGNWRTEDEAAREFDRRADVLASRGFWDVWPEVEGEYIQPRMVSDECGQRCRADRILVPRTKLTDLGWPHGPIGVEIEASYTKVAKPLAQCDGYSRAVFHSPRGFHLILEWWFIWAWSGGTGNLSSVGSQKRIGGVYGTASCPLIFQCGSVHGITWRADGAVTAKALPQGGKAGHRS